MQVILQIAIGIIPLLLAVILMYLRKKHRIISTAVLLLVSVCLFFAFKDMLVQKTANQTKEQTIYLAQRYMEEEDYAQADQLIDKVSRSYGESLATAVNRARLLLLQGKLEAAGVQYEKAMKYETKKEKLSEEEREFALRVIEGKVQSMSRLYQTGALASYIEKSGESPADYGYEASDNGYMEMAEVIDSGVDEILNCLEEETDAYGEKKSAKALEDGLDLKNDLDDLIDQYTLNGTVDNDEAGSISDDMKELYQTNPELFTDGLLEDSQLEAMVLSQDYDSVVELAEQGNMDALLMAANLYQNGTIDENSFSNDFVEENAEGYEEVVAHCEDILINYENDMDEDDEDAQSELAILSDQVDTMKIILDNLALAEVRRRALEQLQEVSEENLSKTLLQVAGIDYYLGDNNQGDEDFTAALDKASLCSDDAYTEPLYNIMEVLSGNETDNNIKDTTIFAEEAYREATSPVLATQTQGASEFSGSVTNYVSTRTAMINIGSIDTSQFPKVTVEVQFGEAPADPDTVLEVLDAGEGITNYKLTKKDYSRSDIVLACDMSGSMEGSEDDLQGAINQFIEQMTSKENISLVGFDDMIEFDTGFTHNKGTLYDSSLRLVPTGGTDIYGALIYGIGTMQQNKDASKIIIAMTDGNDNVMPNTSQLNELRRLCNEGDIIVYTLGLGEVYEEYLTDLANRGNGQFVYCSEAESLKTLYNFIHKQLDNTYELTFDATNQTDNERILKLTDLENDCVDSKTYYLKEETEDAATTEGDGVQYDIGKDAAGVAVTGVDQRAVYKSDKIDMKISALGYGFSTLKDVKVSLVGSRKAYSELTGTVVDDSHISFAIPKGAVLDTYDVEIHADGKTYVFEDAFSIYEPGKRGVVNFGAYSFEADNVSKTNGGYLLKGNVIMNQYLHFKGELTLAGDVSGQNITMTDTLGSYVNCNRQLPGVMSVFLSNTIDVPSFGTITLYNDEAHKYNLDEYTVDTYSISSVTQLQALIVESGNVSLYPDRIEYNSSRMCLDFPCQEIIFNIAKYDNVFAFDSSSATVLNGEGLGMIASAKFEADKSINMGTLPIKLKELEININTLKQDYLIDGLVGLGGAYEDMFKDAAIGAKFEWKGGKWETVLVRFDKDFNLPTASVPVTLSNFFLGVTDMSKVDQGRDAGYIILHSYITGGVDIEVGKLSSIIKPLETFLGDMSICTFEETSFKLRLCNLSLILSTKPKLFGSVDVGEAELRIGNFDYDNYLLGINNQEVGGIYLKLKAGFMWDTSNVDIDVSGEGILTLNNYFAGIEETGTINYDINVLWIKSSEDLQGKLLVGYHNQGKQFVILIKGTDMKNNKQYGVWLSLHNGDILPELKFY